MNVPVVWKSYNHQSPNKGYWDQAMVEDLVTNEMWLPVGAATFVELEDVPESGGAIVVIPARSNFAYIDKINNDLNKLDWVILFLTGDEENDFNVESIDHKNIIIYIMSPRENIDLKKYRPFGTGYPPQIKEYTKNTPAPDKDLNWFFAGQVTHQRRKECVQQLKVSQLSGTLLETKGFTQGFSPKEYYSYFIRSKVAPCPSGPETPDTFRLFEALELGCVPIADTRVAKGGFTDAYWTFFFGEEPPFPVIREYNDLNGYIQDQLDAYPDYNNKVFSWWQLKKRQYSYTLLEDILYLSKEDRVISENTHDQITVIIPISAIKSHPNTRILDETIESVRHHLPMSEIILTFDGVRPENESMRKNYNEFIRRVLWKCNHHYKNVLPVIFNEHQHQTGMARAVMGLIKTQLLLYVEQDTPLVTDYEIPFKNIASIIIDGESDVIRLHHEGAIPKEHSHMILGLEHGTIEPLARTCQWSQRPHVASVAFYKRILSTCFSDNAKSFIEDKMHGVAHNAYLSDGILGWEQYRIHIYYPKGNIKRSYHTDGREGGEKYDDTQVF